MNSPGCNPGKKVPPMRDDPEGVELALPVGTFNQNSEVGSLLAARSAGWQPAVSQVGNLRKPRTISDAPRRRAVRRLSAGDTAGCQPALRRPPGSTSEIGFNPNSEIERRARPPRARFSAPSRKTPAAGNCAPAGNPSRAENAGREGASSHARGGRAPRTSEFGFNPAGVVTVFAARFSGLHPELFTFHPSGMTAAANAKRFGLRWQSAAATPLLGREATLGKRRGAALPAAVQNAARCRAGGRRSAGMRTPGRTAANCPAGHALP